MDFGKALEAVKSGKKNIPSRMEWKGNVCCIPERLP